ncbi:TonB-dependent receptor [Reichenbachiella ulvae]|uniref:TonB-dependent receptor n=1 Tax=Reichenbachiella ulvae TaxID=2980104 RepID=A0ABT3CXM8_9BACT|nr:TonB-dependent receptor [Reichenbachiella ulvae]MCV9388294.1 TonB-dependent receptor [Reichenbachiella ulvae]
MINKCFFILSIAYLLPFIAECQTLLKESYLGESFVDACKSIEQEYEVNIYFDPSWFEGNSIQKSGESKSIASFILENTDQKVYSLLEMYGSYVLVMKNPDYFKATSNQKEDLIVIGTEDAKPNEIVTVTGTIIDGSNDEGLLGAKAYIRTLNIGAISDFNGNYNLKVPVGKYSIEFSSVGYEAKKVDAYIKSSGSFDINLFSGSVELEELVIRAEPDGANVNQRVAGLQQMSAKTIKQLPTFMGEVDPVKSLTTLPGITTAGELSSGFNVRGGESGQNLILQDGAIIYNPTHLFGFYSAFNSDMIDKVDLYKGGGPANYGGRVSSVLSIKLRNGDDQHFKANGGIGLVSSRLTVEGPIVKDKVSFLIGGRTSYTNWLMHSLNNIELNNSSAQFYDFNGKLLYRMSTKDFITASFYRSHDDFNLNNEAVYDWNTQNFSFDWNHIYGDNLISTLNFASSDYWVKTTNQENPLDTYSFDNGINTLSGKLEFQYKMFYKNTVTAGIEYNNNGISPGTLEPGALSSLEYAKIPDQSSQQIDYFIHDDWDLSQRMAVSAGLRYSTFYRFGPDKIYSFEENSSGKPVVSSSQDYKSGELIDNFSALEPRISLRYLLDANTSIKASYYRSFQYLHLVSNTVSATPQDYYLASGPNLKPQFADQFALGAFKNLYDSQYEISVEGYYKDMRNVIDFIEGAEIIGNDQIEGSLVQGIGKSYGVEFQFKKNKGRLNGWISYTYSRSLKKFDGSSEIETINNGKYYSSNFDKPHDLTLVANYKLAPRLILSANFSYSTGRPITVPISKYSYDKTLAVLIYSERNAYRVPDYHRLDISLTLKENFKKNKILSGEWVFSVFNIYGRENAYSIYFNDSGQARKLSILGSAFPSLTYNFRISK